MSVNRVIMLMGGVCLMLSTGCTFCRLQGNGPTGRVDLLSDLRPVDMQQIGQWTNEVYSLKFPWGPRSREISSGSFSG
jgi:hypothetical protein